MTTHLRLLPDVTVRSRARPAEQRSRTVSLRMLRAESRAEKTPAPYWRPEKRGDCLPCPSCQVERDRTRVGIEPSPEPLACGHVGDEVIAHSRPCVYVGCSMNLFLDVRETGSVQFNFPQTEPEDLMVSCAMDCADDGGMTLEQVGMAAGVVRERVRQLENVALYKLANNVWTRRSLGR